ncbi:hypothetical protein UA08_02045 [Talaromyces atroroseus]|uniref:Uncharacterized protein n=1 Tax=Talaromyces atroroseus TaxID=1441469 RepID=A0A1Q5QAQ1_TALAT|nr:hypothetical protein UA08_02045 [Talaromyces atroroseus]OKL63023.1 hypothetical protein UA08_02045 [Talaromyces atroroseus]
MDGSRRESSTSGEISPTVAASLRRAANRDRDDDGDEEDIPESEMSTIEASSEDQEQQEDDKENCEPSSPLPPNSYATRSSYVPHGEQEEGFSDITITPITDASVSSNISVYQRAYFDFENLLNETLKKKQKLERLRLVYYGEDAEEASQYLRRLTPDELRERARERHSGMWFEEWLDFFDQRPIQIPRRRTSDTIPMSRSTRQEEGKVAEEEARIKVEVQEEVLEGIAEEVLERMAEEEREEDVLEGIPEEVPETPEEQGEERRPPTANTSRKRRIDGNASERHAEAPPAKRPRTRNRCNTRGSLHEDVDVPVRRSARIRMQAPRMANRRGDERRKQGKQTKKKEQIMTRSEKNLRRGMRNRKPPDRFVPQLW